MIRKNIAKGVLPYLFDLVEDQFRGRVIFPTSILLIYVLIATYLIDITTFPNNVPEYVNLQLPLQKSYFINQPFTSNFPAPRILVGNKYGPLQNLNIEMKIINLQTPILPQKPICDKSFRESLFKTLDYFRFKSVCLIRITGKTQMTNEFGIANFQRLNFVDVPQGLYSVIFFQPDYAIESQQIQFQVYTTAASLVVDPNTPPPEIIQINEAFAIQPRVTVYDKNSNPVVNITVSIFTWPEPNFSGSQPEIFNAPYRIAWLTGDSVQTNSEGVAIFKNLVVKGSNNQYLYFYFSVSANIVVPWAFAEPIYTNFLNTHVYLQLPTRISSNVGKLLIFGGSYLVKEGVTFDEDFVVQVLDTGNRPMSQKMVFARIIYAHGHWLYNGYPVKSNGKYNKELYFPVPGIYNENSNTLDLLDVFYPFYTNATGHVVFRGMTFSPHGVTGLYKIIFECDQGEAISQNIHVITQVENVIFLEQPPSQVNLNFQILSDTLTASLQVINGNSQGVIGKTPKILFVQKNTSNTSSYVQVQSSVMDLKLDLTNPAFNPSIESGFIQLYFQLSRLNVASITFNMLVDFDPQDTQSSSQTIQKYLSPTLSFTTIMSSSITIFNSNSYLLDYFGNPTCGTIKINFAKTLYVTPISVNTINFTVLDETGNYLINQKLYITPNILSDTLTTIPENSFPNFNQIFRPTFTDFHGSAVYSNFILGKGSEGSIQLYATVYNPLQGINYNLYKKYISLLEVGVLTENEQDELNQYIYDEVENQQLKVCTSDAFYFEFKPGFQKIQIQMIQEYESSTNALLRDSSSFPLVYNNIEAENNKLQTKNFAYYIFTLNITNNIMNSNSNSNTENQIFKQNQQLDIEGVYVMMPPYMFGDYIYNNNLQLDSIQPLFVENGVQKVKIKVSFESFRFGIHSIQFYCYGKFTSPYTFNIVENNLNISQIQMTKLLHLSTRVLWYNGNFLPLFKVNVQYNKQPFYQYQFFVSLKQQSTELAYMEFSDLGPNNDVFSVVNSKFRKQQPDSNGNMFFRYMSVYEIYSIYNFQQCIDFQIIIGQQKSQFCSNQFTSWSINEDPICFYSQKSVVISPKNYSTFISASQTFPVPITVKITKSIQSNYDMYGIPSFFAMTLQNGENYLQYPNKVIPAFLQNYVCIYNNSKPFPGLSNCGSQFKIIGNGPYIVSITFHRLQWIGNSENQNIILGFPDFLNYNPLTQLGNYKHLLFREQATFTSYIQVQNDPLLMMVIGQPPKVIFVNQVFIVKVFVIMKSGMPAIGEAVQYSVNVDANAFQNLASTQLKQILHDSTQQPITDESASTVAKQMNIASSYNLEFTSKNGIATFSIKIKSGISGNYSFVFQAGKVRSSPSSVFLLLNQIQSIKFIQQPDQLIYISGSYQVYKMQSQPILQINYQNFSEIIGSKVYQIRVYPYLSQSQMHKVQKINSFINNYETVYDMVKQTISGFSDSVWDTFSKMINALQQNGVAYNQNNQNYENMKVEFSNPLEYPNGTLYFGDLGIVFQQPGTYMLIVLINGIESVPSNKIVVQLSTDINQQNLQYIVIILIIVVVILVLLGNQPTNHYLIIILNIPLLIITFTIYSIAFNSYIYYKTMVITIMSIVIVSNFLKMLKMIQKVLNKKNNAQFDNDIREQILHEYAHQILFYKPSQNWIDYQGKGFNYKLPYRNINKDQLYPDLTKNSSYYQFDIQSYKFKTQTRLIKIRNLFRPFTFYLNRIIIIDCYFFSMRLITAIMMSSISVLYLTVTYLNLSFSVMGYINKLNTYLLGVYFQKMTSALAQFLAYYPKFLLNEVDYIYTEGVIDYLVTQLQILANCISNALLISIIIADIIFIISILLVLYDFQNRILNMRVGKHTYKIQRTKLRYASNFIGVYVANSIFSFTLFVFLLTIVITLPLHPLFWQLIKEYIMIVAGILLSSTVAVLLLSTIAQYFFFADRNLIKINRTFYSLYEFFIFFGVFFGGVFISLYRILLLLIVQLIGFVRVDQTILPKWANDFAYMDPVQKDYLSMITMHHLHNNPLVLCFTNYCSCHMSTLQLHPSKQGRIRSKSQFYTDGEMDEFKTNMKVIKRVIIRAIIKLQNPSILKYCVNETYKVKLERINQDFQYKDLRRRASFSKSATYFIQQ